VIGKVVPITLNVLLPPMVALVTDRFDPPVFEILIVCVEVLFATVLGNVTVVGVIEICAGGAVTVTSAEADFVLSAALVAVTVKLPALAGAV
jgi:hypothetical protein